jgi:SWI/SNF-related matrix-associated actin-dependent regulator of chromatin subfamily A3
LVWATPGQRGFNTTSRPSTTAAAVKKAAVAPAPIPLPSQQAMTSANARSQQEAAQKYQESLKKAAELKQILNSLEKVEDDGRRSSLLDTLCSTEDVLNMPVHENPPGIASGELTVDLLKHQVSNMLCWIINTKLTSFLSSFKLLNGVLNGKIQFFLRQQQIPRCNSGS